MREKKVSKTETGKRDPPDPLRFFPGEPLATGSQTLPAMEVDVVVAEGGDGRGHSVRP